MLRVQTKLRPNLRSPAFFSDAGAHEPVRSVEGGGARRVSVGQCPHRPPRLCGFLEASSSLLLHPSYSKPSDVIAYFLYHPLQPRIIFIISFNDFKKMNRLINI